jgi:hypothetical protein
MCDLQAEVVRLIDENQRLRAELKFNTPPAPQPVPVKTYHDGKPWPVAPKPWVGLSRNEVLDIEETTTHPLAFYQAIEQRLKEKNT